jgi:hypothetical protein
MFRMPKAWKLVAGDGAQATSTVCLGLIAEVLSGQTTRLIATSSRTPFSKMFCRAEGSNFFAQVEEDSPVIR